MTGQMAKDPVCGMTVDPSAADHVADVDGQHFWFCSASCRQTFLTDPGHRIKHLADPTNSNRVQEVHHGHH